MSFPLSFSSSFSGADSPSFSFFPYDLSRDSNVASTSAVRTPRSSSGYNRVRYTVEENDYLRRLLRKTGGSWSSEIADKFCKAVRLAFLFPSPETIRGSDFFSSFAAYPFAFLSVPETKPLRRSSALHQKESSIRQRRGNQSEEASSQLVGQAGGKEGQRRFREGREEAPMVCSRGSGASCLGCSDSRSESQCFQEVACQSGSRLALALSPSLPVEFNHHLSASFFF